MKHASPSCVFSYSYSGCLGVLGVLGVLPLHTRVTFQGDVIVRVGPLVYIIQIQIYPKKAL